DQLFSHRRALGDAVEETGDTTAALAAWGGCVQRREDVDLLHGEPPVALVLSELDSVVQRERLALTAWAMLGPAAGDGMPVGRLGCAVLTLHDASSSAISSRETRSGRACHSPTSPGSGSATHSRHRSRTRRTHSSRAS